MRLTDAKAINFTPTLTRQTISGGANIDDDHTLTTATWSSQKISNELAGKANTSSIADEYTTGASYYVGDVCSYRGNLYRCTTAIGQAPATFNPASWTTYVVLESFASTAQVRTIINGYTPT